MADKVGSIYVDLDLDHKKYDQGAKSVERANKEMSASSEKLNKHAGQLKLALLAAGTAAVAFGVSCVKSFMESENQIAQTNAVIKSTGGVAGVTAKDVTKLAISLQKTTAFSDEQVRSVQNMALTFTGISKKIFPEVTKTALDMATALNHGLTPSGEEAAETMKLLGKALQDPDAGLGALKRVGVNVDELKLKFKDSMSVQEKQKLILKELSTEFGGSAASAAKTYSGRILKLKNDFDDLQEKIGKVLIDGLYKFGNWIVKHKDILIKFGLVVAGVVAIWVAWSLAMDALALTQTIYTAVTSATTVALWGMSVPLIVIEAAVLAIVLAVGGFAIALVLLYQKNEWFHNFVNETWTKIAAIIKEQWEKNIKPALERLKVAFDNIVQSVRNFLQEHPAFVEALKTIAKIFGGLVLISIVGWFQGLAMAVQFLATVLNMVADALQAVSELISNMNKMKTPSWLETFTHLGGRDTNIGNGLSHSLDRAVNAQVPEKRSSGRRASGGFQSMGELGLVGEQGPELFVPDTPGHIVDAQRTAALMSQAMGSAPTTMQIYVNVDGVTAMTRPQAKEFGSYIIDSVNDDLRKRGAPLIGDGYVRSA